MRLIRIVILLIFDTLIIIGLVIIRVLRLHETVIKSRSFNRCVEFSDLPYRIRKHGSCKYYLKYYFNRPNSISHPLPPPLLTNNKVSYLHISSLLAYMLRFRRECRTRNRPQSNINPFVRFNYDLGSFVRYTILLYTTSP